MRIIFIGILLLIYVPMQAQNSFDSLSNATQKQKQLLVDLPGKIVLNYEELSATITIQNSKLLNKFFSNEKKVLKEIVKAANINGDDMLKACETSYRDIVSKCNIQPGEINELNQYIGRIDSVETMLAFLKIDNPNDQKIAGAIKSVGILKGKINQSEIASQFIAGRRTMLTSLISRYSNLPGGVLKSVEKFSNQFRNYQDKLANWKANLNESVKMGERVLEILNKIPAFKSFWQENSQLAKLFGGSSVVIPSIAGLQSRQSIVQDIQQRYGTEIGNAQQMLRQNLRSASKELDVLKNKINTLKNGNVATETPGSTITEESNLPSKGLSKKLELGFNLQAGKKAAYDFPVSNDLGLSIGYKFNDKMETGLGISYKFGLGSNWKKIKLSHDGIGLRSYIDLKVSSPQKGIRVLFSNLWLSAGYEQNYWRTFRNFPELKQVAWQASGLVGISKRIEVNSKFFKYAKMQLLWDFLNYKQAAVSQPILFRMGYAIK